MLHVHYIRPLLYLQFCHLLLIHFRLKHYIVEDILEPHLMQATLRLP